MKISMKANVNKSDSKTNDQQQLKSEEFDLVV